MVLIETESAGSYAFIGPGAGGGPTATAIVADLVDLARGNKQSVFGQPTQNLTPAPAWQGPLPFPLAP